MASTSSPVGRLAEVAGGRLLGDPAVTVRDATHDSRQAGPGTLFVAVPGARQDGHDFIYQAVGAGSPAVMVERAVGTSVPQIVVTSARVAMAPVAAEVHGHPSRRLAVVGVTGTNGKTTVTHMVESIAAAAGMRVGLIGTVHTRVGRRNIPNTRTTPEATDFQRLLAKMVELGSTVVSAEVSSHALAMHRVDMTRFAVAAFTNLSQDHMDFHGDMETYFAAKAGLFRPDMSERAVVWVDDPAGRRLMDMIEIPVMTVGEDADVSARGSEVSVGGSRFTLVSPEGERAVDLRLGGDFNIDNALLAAACGLSLGASLDDVAQGLERFDGVPGRFELVSGSDPVQVIVDYAHTPAGIASAISTVRGTAPGAWVDRGGERRVIVVFGAGGDRDRAKRPQMGSAALAADVVIVTSDNPRSEDPKAIIDEILTGVDDPARVRRQTDRRRAIAEAVGVARDGDVVLVLGRGHERGQEVAGRLLPFDDRLVAREALAARREAQR
jgi:UDP-N-acetylmuramoyl-L-alanyl-D-glutamate--2,6-diaminopimelate ligase